MKGIQYYRKKEAETVQYYNSESTMGFGFSRQPKTQEKFQLW